MSNDNINHLNTVARFYGGKVVKVRQDRKCFFGGYTIEKGEYCVSAKLFPKHVYNSTNRPKTIWICGDCGECTH